jgi:hypothetical protein
MYVVAKTFKYIRDLKKGDVILSLWLRKNAAGEPERNMEPLTVVRVQKRGTSELGMIDVTVRARDGETWNVTRVPNHEVEVR